MWGQDFRNPSCVKRPVHGTVFEKQKILKVSHSHTENQDENVFQRLEKMLHKMGPTFKAAK